MRELARYRAKRDPDRTPEPFGGEEAAPGRAEGGCFVVQQHAARRMHWDLRLEIEGVLVSWAVPRGPSLDPAERRLALRTEDHPLAYADFEGVIPAGNYGAGAMIVWDRGVFRTADGAPAAAGLAAGKLDLRLFGHKLHGRFALVRTRREGGRDWLLLHKGEPAAEPEVVEALPGSVLSGLTVEELRSGACRGSEVAAAAREAGAPEGRPDAARLRPMLATAERRPFSREGWLFELKYDGVRVLCEREGERVRLFARGGAPRTGTWPEVARALRHLPLDHFVVDGEIVALDEGGRSSFERLQRRFTQTDPDAIARVQAEIPAQLRAFDCLAAAGRDLRGLPLAERKRILSRFAPRRGFVSFADHVEADGLALYEAARSSGLEGVVAKRADSRYEAGRRSQSWLKVKVPLRAALVVVGWLEGSGSRRRLGSLALGWYADGELRYAGHVGSGLDEATIEALLARLEPLRSDAPPCEVPRTPGRRAAFATPRIVCEVRYNEVTGAGILRQPVFERLREDLAPADCRAPRAREQPPDGDAPAPREVAFQPTRREKIFWPVEGHTKGDLLDYYEAAWPWLAPYLRDRPLVLTRHPDGIEGKHFYQKNAPAFTPAWARRESIDGTDYFVCNDLRTLLYAVNSGAIPLHVWSARLGSLDRPDWLVLDLDPKQAPFSAVVEVARRIHRLCREIGAPHFVKTSGQAGLHVLLPLGARLGHAEARTLAEVLARVVCAEAPDLATVVRPLGARGRRVYLDFLQNGRGKLIAAPFSVRPRPGAPVSTPLTWRQVGRRLDPARFTIRSALREVRRRGDPLRPVLSEPLDAETVLEALSLRLTRERA